MILDATGKKLRRAIGFTVALCAVSEPERGERVSLVSSDRVDVDEEQPAMTVEQPECQYTKMS